MQIHNNISLKDFNSFKIDVQAKQLIDFNMENELVDFIKEKNIDDNYLIMGGGYNLLFTQDFEGQVLRALMDDISIVKQNDKEIFIKVGAGKYWPDLVDYCVDNNWSGIENLSDIPGNVGSTVIQNIGAYGVEVKDTIVRARAIEISSGEIKEFSNKECEFGYRDSVFKKRLKKQYIFTYVTFCLLKSHKANVSYKALSDELNKKGILSPSLKQIRDSINDIRTFKLPDPDEIANAGSFFKNPVINKELFDKLKNDYPNIPSYIISENAIKVPAAWLIDTCGWKGFIDKNSDAGVHKNQALVIVNYGNAKGSDIIKLAIMIQQSVKEKFSINLYPEVEFI